MLLSDAVCDTTGDEPKVPVLSVGYAYYLENLINGYDAPESISLAIPSPCATSSLFIYKTLFHQASLLTIDELFFSPLLMQYLEKPYGDADQWITTTAESATPGSALLRRHFNINDGGEYEWGGHAVCLNARGEVFASAQERTMLEITHCCGTMDYYTGGAPDAFSPSPSILDFSPAETYHDMTCLTLKGMINIFCEYVESEIIPSGINLRQSDLFRDMLLKIHPNTAILEYFTFDFLVSRETCMDLRTWESPRIIFSLIQQNGASLLDFATNSGNYAPDQGYQNQYLPGVHLPTTVSLPGPPDFPDINSLASVWLDEGAPWADSPDHVAISYMAHVDYFSVQSCADGIPWECGFGLFEPAHTGTRMSEYVIVGADGGGSTNAHLSDQVTMCYTVREDDQNVLDIYMTNSEAVAGYQFQVDSQDGSVVSQVSDGVSADLGFTPAFSDFMVLSFSLVGAFIPEGEHLLTSLTMAGPASAVAGLIDVTVSSPSGSELQK